MENNELDQRFMEAFARASEMSQADLPQDTQLRLYAFFKQGSQSSPSVINYNTGIDLRSAFKTNAWLQVRDMPVDQAKELYIALVEELLTGQNPQ